MTLRKFDDDDGTEIPLTGGLEVVVSLLDGSRVVQHFAVWDHIPKRLLDGKVAGQQVASVQIRDLTAVVAAGPNPDSPAARRAAHQQIAG